MGIIGTGASAVQAIPRLGAASKELYVFQRTPSSIDIKDDWPTDPEWAKKPASRMAGQAARERARMDVARGWRIRRRTGRMFRARKRSAARRTRISNT